MEKIFWGVACPYAFFCMPYTVHVCLALYKKGTSHTTNIPKGLNPPNPESWYSPLFICSITCILTVTVHVHIYDDVEYYGIILLL